VTGADHQRREINSIGSMLSVMAAARYDPFARMLNVELIAVLVAALLPWSTSGVGIGVLIWLVALAATLELRPFLRSLQRPICALPIALVALAAVGTLWSEASWGARLYALSPTTKLLFLPFLFYHFERSTRGMWVFGAFLASCTLLTVASIVVIDPSLSLKGSGEPTGHGIFVKNYIDQSLEFVLCTVVLAFPIITLRRAGKVRQALLLTLWPRTLSST
jgi:O-antigen ligase